MRSLLLFSLLLYCVSSNSPRSLKSLWNFERVAECVLHYRALIYNDYGCWCGVGGAHEPVDEIDRCCMFHDKCYDEAVDEKKCFDVPWEYVDPYKWTCFKNNSTAVCEPDQGSCKTSLCACDTAVVACWSRQPRPLQKAKCNWSYDNIEFARKRSKYFRH